ncbi:MAG TPA: hypothetical protein DHW82_11220 [Spirochaetia bacterium]|nr:MAG: hypothetical protein A2Y41_05670 [Spirochaetes bacterium GWB1_36_13]HCL57562.1 hypothetical protein [Spirochaetia bacterium]
MDWTEFFKILSDSTRLRILNLLNDYELNVNEILEILSMQQSRVSKHLKLLKDHDLVIERKEGTWRFYTLNQKKIPDTAIAMLTLIWEKEAYQQERSQIPFILEKRKLFAEDFFISSSLSKQGLGSFYSVEDLMLGFSFLLKEKKKILDAGCGDGKLLWFLAHNPEIELYGIDVYKTALSHSVFKDEDKDIYSRINLFKADIAQTPFQNDFFDAVFTNMVLHHIPNPKKVFVEMERVLKKGGKWIIIDFYKHNYEEMREVYKDFWLGFSREEMQKYAANSGLKEHVFYLSSEKNTEEKNSPEKMILVFEKN